MVGEVLFLFYAHPAVEISDEYMMVILFLWLKAATQLARQVQQERMCDGNGGSLVRSHTFYFEGTELMLARSLTERVV